jgi:hypothetical protein
LEKEEIIRGVNVFTNVRRRYDGNKMKELRVGQDISADELKQAYKGDYYRSSFRNVALEEAQLSSQMDAELEFGGRLEGLADNAPQSPISGGVSTGVLPIQIKVPTSGQVYRFAKTIIRPEDPLTFSVAYTRMWVTSAAKWIAIGLVLLIGYWNRRRLLRIGRWTSAQLNEIAGWIKKREEAIKRYAQSVVTPFVLFGLFLLFWRVSGFLALFCFFLLWASLAYQVMRILKKRRQVRTASKTPAGEHGAGQP